MYTLQTVALAVETFKVQHFAAEDDIKLVEPLFVGQVFKY
jgi:hypothetical protein